MSESTSESDWGTEAEQNGENLTLNGKVGADFFVKKADRIIDQIGESWSLAFNADSEPTKAEFKEVADHVKTLLANDATLSRALSEQMQLNVAHGQNICNKINDHFGEALEAAVQIQEIVRALQTRYRELAKDMEKKKETFVKEILALKLKHAEEIQKEKDRIQVKLESFHPKIQAAKNNKAEQKEVQLKLAKLLAEGLT
ncbi:hypothetical protein O181_004841 [Austropuccinia psidii MF-1]|uniref:Uncharacterized protein n=1 Tax=Austropuccinia psidii MF-1 TaxID=1389203 RepID=A0A9Q3BHR6_9BASI|nr:hypothetical protein [Austropuccinia psidii MF-1]